MKIKLTGKLDFVAVEDKIKAHIENTDLLSVLELCKDKQLRLTIETIENEQN